MIAGDLQPMNFDGNEHRIPGWYQHKFGPWLVELVERGIIPVCIAGNHDFLLRDARLKIERMKLPWVYLEDSGIEIGGVKFWGSPWQPWFGGWAYNAPEFDGEDFLYDKFSLIPEDTDVLITHSPPCGILDWAGRSNVGSISLTKHVERVMPKLHIFGHIHLSYGVKQIGDITFCNAAQVDGKYKLVNNPVLFDV